MNGNGAVEARDAAGFAYERVTMHYRAGRFRSAFELASAAATACLAAEGGNFQTCRLIVLTKALAALRLGCPPPVRADLPRTDEQAGEAGRLPLFDETRETLALRVQRLSTGLAWSEIPPTRSCRLVGNVTVDDDGSGRLLVHTNLIVFRSRSPGDDVLVAGAREDRWSRSGESWLLHERRILLTQRLVENLSIFF